MQTSEPSSKTGFKTPNEFSIHIEQIKQQYEFDTYIDAVIWFSENECDLEIEQIAKFLNKKIKEAIEFEANSLNLLKETSKVVDIF